MCVSSKTLQKTGVSVHPIILTQSFVVPLHVPIYKQSQFSSTGFLRAGSGRIVLIYLNFLKAWNKWYFTVPGSDLNGVIFKVWLPSLGLQSEGWGGEDAVIPLHQFISTNLSLSVLLEKDTVQLGEEMFPGDAARALNFGIGAGVSGAYSHCWGVWEPGFPSGTGLEGDVCWMGSGRDGSGRTLVRNVPLKNFQAWMYPNYEFPVPENPENGLG